MSGLSKKGPIVGKILFLQLVIVLAVTLNYCIGFALSQPLSPYMSGEQRLAAIKADPDHELAHEIHGEIGHHVRVPLDYKNPSEGTIGVYYFTQKEFNPELPTILYFQGGPGGSAHDMPAFRPLENWNALFIEYRGMGLSYPDTIEQFWTTKYFTSENVARDAAEVVKALGIKKVSVYGSSYGTLTATIFSSLFPELIRGVVLEGIIYKGDEYLWSSAHRQKILQNYLDHKIPPELRERVVKFSKAEGVHPAWFSRIAQSAMYGDDFEDNLTMHLAFLLDGKDEDIISNLSGDPDAMFNMDDMFVFSPIFFLHIACKELSGFADHASFNFVFEGEKLVPMKQTVVLNACQEMKIDPTLTKPYSALDYPISVPITYVQGVEDGATTAPTGIWHYKNVPTGKAQLFLIKKAGHGHLISNLHKEDYRNLLEKMLNGVQTPAEEFQKDFASKYPQWVTTLK